MDGVYIVPSEEKPREQASADAWLMEGPFNSMNNLPRPTMGSNTQDAGTNAIAADGSLIDPENFLTGEIHFPDLTDLSPRGVVPQEDNGKPSAPEHDSIRPDMINIGKPPFEDGAALQVDSSTGNSLGESNMRVPGGRAGVNRSPMSQLESNLLHNVNIPFDAALHGGGIGGESMPDQGVKMNSIVNPSTAPLPVKNDVNLQSLPAADPAVEIPLTKRQKTAERRASGGPGKTQSKLATKAGSSADGGESSSAKGSSSKTRSTTPRARSVRTSYISNSKSH